MSHRKNVTPTLFLYIVCSLWGCMHPDQASLPYDAPKSFDHPQDLLFVGSDLLVTNTGYRPRNWADGFLSIIDVEAEIIKQTLYTLAQNPQTIVFDEPWIAVVETGHFDFSDFEHPKSKGPFGIELIRKTSTTYESQHFIELPDTYLGEPISAPVDMATIDAVTLVTSGLFNIVWRIEWDDYENAAVTKIDVVPLGSSLDTGLGAVQTWNNFFVITDFNADEIHLIDSADIRTICTVDINSDEGMIMGVQTPMIIDNMLYLSMAFSGSVLKIDLARMRADCPPAIEYLPTVLGQVPNDLDQVGNEIWFTVSGENHITRINAATHEALDTIVLPVGSNPWSFEFSDELGLGAVSLWQNHAVQFIDASGSLEGLINDSTRTGR